MNQLSESASLYLQLMDGVHYAIGPTDTKLPDTLGEIDRDTEVAAYVCHSQRCLPPVSSLEAANQQLGSVMTGPASR